MATRPIKELTFDELVDLATQRIHSALLEEGSKGMKSAVNMWLQQVIMWSLEQQKKVAKKG